MSTVSKFRRKLEGVVVSDKSLKTAVVSVTRKFKHGTYGKFLNQTKKYHAHDELSKAKVGDKVTIIESRPYSKLKRWEVLSIQK